MAWPTASLDLVVKQVLEKLLASPEGARYTLAIGTSSEFKVLQELKDNALLVDQSLCFDIMDTWDHPYGSKFLVLDDANEYVSGAQIVPHLGKHGDILISVDDGDTYSPGLIYKSRDEMLRMIAARELYGGKSLDCVVDNRYVYHNGDKAKLYLPVFEKTDACQSPQQYEDILICGTIDGSEKLDAADPFFQKHAAAYRAYRGLVRGGAEFVPTMEQMTQRVA